MPCPFFEPTRIAPNPQAAHARLPLLAEYDGLCHATTIPGPPDAQWRFAGCNHGRDQQSCPRFPLDAKPAVRRFTVQSRTLSCLELLVCEEVDYMPVRWRSVEYATATGVIYDSEASLCELAQIRAFCAAYLQRFPESTQS